MNFWEQKTLQEMNQQEWESLCDGCAVCCVLKIQDEDTDEIFFTNIVCHFLDSENGRCGDYDNRCKNVPTCIQLTPENADQLYWMPNTCAYRLLAEGKPLPQWHHLISGDRESVHHSSISIRGRVVSEAHIHPDDVDEFVVEWWDEKPAD
ncbi:MAG: YcgN family cysteine cluster protein [Proteobacteria bacterium]|nr:YcgN family cysteine cluster protein [Pseudomonadota bacterium]